MLITHLAGNRMENVTIRACSYDLCPSVSITGKDVGKIALTILATIGVCYIIHKLR
jgi:hypothetical protein